LTIVTQNRECLFGEIEDGVIHLSNYGEIVQCIWLEIPKHFLNLKLDEYVIMPNHIHGIIHILDKSIVGARHAVPLQKSEHFSEPVHGSLPTIIRSFKSAATKHVNIEFKSPGTKLWQRSFYDHVIRNETELNIIREYIIINLVRWDMDKENTKLMM